MGFLLKLFGGIGGGWIFQAVFAAAVFAAGGVFGGKIDAAFKAPIIARAQTAQAQAEVRTAEALKALADYHAQVEKERADANALAVTQEAALRGTITALSTQLKAKEDARQKASNDLLHALSIVPVAERGPLSAGAADYYRRVRELQAAPAAANPTPAGNPDTARLPVN